MHSTDKHDTIYQIIQQEVRADQGTELKPFHQRMQRYGYTRTEVKEVLVEMLNEGPLSLSADGRLALIESGPASASLRGEVGFNQYRNIVRRSVGN